MVLEVLQALTSNTQIVKEMLHKGSKHVQVVLLAGMLTKSVCLSVSLSVGALLYLLDLFCNAQSPTVREQTAALLAKMTTDKLVGPKVRIMLCKFLPTIFIDAMRDSPEASVNMFESM